MTETKSAKSQKATAPNPEFTPRVTQDQDGKYRWVYEMNLFKNPAIFFLIWKIFFFILVGIFGVVLIVDATSWAKTDPTRITGDLKVFGYVLAGMTGLTLLGYLVYAVKMGGKYIVEFEMDEKGVNHAQTAAQAAKAKRMGRAAMIAGAATGNFGAAGAGVAAQRTEMYSQFDKVTSVRSKRLFHTIKVNEPLNHNQVYACKEDYDFVLDYIRSHCPNLKSKQSKPRDAE